MKKIIKCILLGLSIVCISCSGKKNAVQEKTDAIIAQTTVEPEVVAVEEEVLEERLKDWEDLKEKRKNAVQIEEFYRGD